MAELKSKHETVLNMVDEIVEIVSRLCIAHNDAEDFELDGRHVTLRGKKMLYFGSCGYLGLEFDERLKAGAIESIHRYGTQFSSSRAYISSVFYKESEDLLRKMFNKPLILLQSLTLGHITNIPIIVGDNDAVILDAQVHDSVQSA